MRVMKIVVMGILALRCGGDDDGQEASCADLSAAAAVSCQGDIDEGACSAQCEAAGHPAEHRNMASDCLDEAKDCSSAIACLNSNGICDGLGSEGESESESESEAESESEGE